MSVGWHVCNRNTVYVIIIGVAVAVVAEVIAAIVATIVAVVILAVVHDLVCRKLFAFALLFVLLLQIRNSSCYVLIRNNLRTDRFKVQRKRKMQKKKLRKGKRKMRKHTNINTNTRTGTNTYKTKYTIYTDTQPATENVEQVLQDDAAVYYTTVTYTQR